MKFTQTPLDGLRLIEHEPHGDHRGSFCRLYCEDAFSRAGLNSRLPQINLSRSAAKGTLRGLHLQTAPHEETKVIQCLRGRIFDVAVDVRPDSPTYCRWFGVELSAGNGRALYIPGGFAHGLQTLEDDTEVLYFMGASYSPAHGQSMRWNDPAFAIDWPIGDPILSDKDRNAPAFVP